MNLSPIEILHILQSNSTGPVSRMIQDYLASSGVVDQAVLEEVWTSLIERFGSQKQIADQIKRQLSEFRVISGRDIGSQLRRLYDLCKIASFNISRSAELSILNLSTGLKPIWIKLPRNLQESWRKCGQNYEDRNNGTHPPFEVFVSFLKEKAREYSNSNYDNPAIQPDSKNKVMWTETKAESNDRTKTGNKNENSCPIHNTSSHSLINCKAFKKLYHLKKG